jgi:hypothetical protein
VEVAAAAAAAAEDAEVAASTGGSAEADGTGTTKEEATAGAVEAVATITKGLAAAEGAAPARAAARRTGPAVAARGRRRRVRGEAVGLAASTPPSGGQRRRLRLGRLRLRPWSRKRRVRRDPLVSASPDLLAPTIQLLHCSAFGVRDIFKVPFRAAMIISGLSKKKKNSSMVDRVVGAVWFGADQRCLAQADNPGVGLSYLVWSRPALPSQGRFGADQHCLAKAEVSSVGF